MQVVPGRAGAEVSEEKRTIKAKKDFPTECSPDRPERCPSHFFAVSEPSGVTCFDACHVI